MWVGTVVEWGAGERARAPIEKSRSMARDGRQFYRGHPGKRKAVRLRTGQCVCVVFSVPGHVPADTPLRFRRGASTRLSYSRRRRRRD